jgi:cbb3-type cytochrome oxidase subunit 3
MTAENIVLAMGLLVGLLFTVAVLWWAYTTATADDGGETE